MADENLLQRLLAMQVDLSAVPPSADRIFKNPVGDGYLMMPAPEIEPLSFKPFDITPPRVEFVATQRFGIGVSPRPRTIMVIDKLPCPRAPGVDAMIRDGWVWTGFRFERDPQPDFGMTCVRRYSSVPDPTMTRASASSGPMTMAGRACRRSSAGCPVAGRTPLRSSGCRRRCTRWSSTPRPVRPVATPTSSATAGYWRAATPRGSRRTASASESGPKLVGANERADPWRLNW